MHTDYESIFAENPEYLLALQLSAPTAARSDRQAAVVLKFDDDSVTATVDRIKPDTVRLLASKDTIFVAILLFILWKQRGATFLETLNQRFEEFAEDNVREHETYMPADDVLNTPSGRPRISTALFLERINASGDETGTAWSRTEQALAFLENEDLAIDPVLTGALMVLAGLVPVRFSVRTPKGERVNKQYRWGALYWSLDIKKGNKTGTPFTDIDFNFRGVHAVKNSLLSLAKDFVASEEGQRTARGKKILPRPPDLDFDN
jgi:hypothetical protein